MCVLRGRVWLAGLVLICLASSRAASKGVSLFNRFGSTFLTQEAAWFLRDDAPVSSRKMTAAVGTCGEPRQNSCFLHDLCAYFNMRCKHVTRRQPSGRFRNDRLDFRL